MMRVGFAITLVAVVALGACFYTPDIAEGLYCTGANRLCPPGQTCGADDRCYKPENVGDARVIDARPLIDATLVDALDPSMCSLVEQTVCTSAYKCTVYHQPPPAGKFCDMNGNVARNFLCTITGLADNCARGNLCVFDHCREFCNDTTDCVADVELCVPLDDGSFKVCLTKCNPLATPPQCATESGVSRSCYANSDGGICARTGDRLVGNSCDAENQCVDGAGCHDGFCRTYCAYPGGACSSGVCTDHGTGSVGACVP